jgi:tRNA(Arg) A34 adenosine deaminase TadA
MRFVRKAELRQKSLSQRRSFLKRCLGLCGGILIIPAYIPHSARGEEDASGHKQFVSQASKMKREAIDAGDQPYGAIVVKDRKIVGFGPSHVITQQDPTAHAEMEAIRDAARRLGTRDLGGCVLYSTSRPCSMCETAAYWANISSMYFGDTPSPGGKPSYGC